MDTKENNEISKDKISFVAKPSRSGYKVLINIPAELRDTIDKESYYKVYLIKVHFNDF